MVIAVAVLRQRRRESGVAVPEATNPAKQLARALAGRPLFIYTGAGPLAAVAVRWRQQFNENAKVLAHSAVVPEHNHNEIVAWQVASPTTRAIAVLVLRDGEDSNAATARLDLAAEYAARQGAAAHEIRSQLGAVTLHLDLAHQVSLLGAIRRLRDQNVAVSRVSTRTPRSSMEGKAAPFACATSDRATAPF